MKSAFPIQKVEPISGEPTMEWLMDTNKKIVKCTKKQDTDHGPLRFFFLVLPANVYFQITTINPGSIRQPLNTLVLEKTWPPTDRGNKIGVKQEEKGVGKLQNMNDLMIKILLGGINQEFKEDIKEGMVRST